MGDELDTTTLIHSDAEHAASPLAAAAPPLPAADYRELVRAVSRDGLISPIVLHRGDVLEGRNRYRACIDAGITPEFREWSSDPGDGDDPAAWAEEQNPRGLTTTERDALADAERIIDAGLRTFVEVGQALQRVRDDRLWRGLHESFDAWAQERWEISRRHADRTIAAAEVVALLPTEGPLPHAEAVARELAPLREDPDTARAAWAEAVELCGDTPTAAEVRGVVAEKLPDRDPDTASTDAPASTAPSDAPGQNTEPEPEWDDPAEHTPADAPEDETAGEPEAETPQRKPERDFAANLLNAVRSSPGAPPAAVARLVATDPDGAAAWLREFATVLATGAVDGA